MRSRQRKAKYDQWDQEDGLTLAEKRARLRQRLSRKLGREISEAEVQRLLSQVEQRAKYGLVGD